VFAAKHAEVADGLDAWYQMIKRGAYRSPHEVRNDFPSASFLGDGVTIFDIGSFRLTVHMKYNGQVVYIRSLETHAEYDRSNKARRKK
jgi:mRNA interferase HigB